jgi:nitrogen fixation protein FixH
MTWLVGGVIALVVGANAVMIWIAVGARPDLVQPDYYAASRRVDAEQAARAASDRLGWSVTPAGQERSGLTLRITDGQGRPVSGLRGTVSAYRPSDGRLDQALVWQESTQQPGRYRATFPRPAEGLWSLRLDLRRGEHRLYTELTFAAP